MDELIYASATSLAQAIRSPARQLRRRLSRPVYARRGTRLLGRARKRLRLRLLRTHATSDSLLTLPSLTLRLGTHKKNLFAYFMPAEPDEAR